MTQNNIEFIYVITVMQTCDASVSKLLYKNCSNYGIFTNFDLAKECVLQNICDMNENGYYDHVVIEKLRVNSAYFIPYNTKDPDQQIWYKFDKNINQYIKIDKPEFAKNICGWVG